MTPNLERLLSEDALSFPDLAQERNVTLPTVWRWVSAGLQGVRLESFRMGGKRLATRQAFLRFIAALNNLPLPDRAAIGRKKSVERAEKILARAGI